MSVLADHPVFSRFPPWRGHVAAGYVVNFVGQLIDVEFLRGFSWATLDRMVDRYESPGYGQIYEETFEWLIMLEAILAAKDTFTMIDLGSGFGRWLIRRSLRCAPSSTGAQAAPDWRRAAVRSSSMGLEAFHR